MGWLVGKERYMQNREAMIKLIHEKHLGNIFRLQKVIDEHDFKNTDLIEANEILYGLHEDYKEDLFHFIKNH